MPYEEYHQTDNSNTCTLHGHDMQLVHRAQRPPAPQTA